MSKKSQDWSLDTPTEPGVYVFYGCTGENMDTPPREQLVRVNPDPQRPGSLRYWGMDFYNPENMVGAWLPADPCPSIKPTVEKMIKTRFLRNILRKLDTPTIHSWTLEDKVWRSKDKGAEAKAMVELGLEEGLLRKIDDNDWSWEIVK